MKALFAACLARLGLSQVAASEVFGWRLDTVKSWYTGRKAVPRGIWDELRAYERLIVDRSEAIREAWEQAGERAGEMVDARWTDHAGVMALADFVLSTEVEPGEVSARSVPADA